LHATGGYNIKGSNGLNWELLKLRRDMVALRSVTVNGVEDLTLFNVI